MEKLVTRTWAIALLVLIVLGVVLMDQTVKIKNEMQKQQQSQIETFEKIR